MGFADLTTEELEACRSQLQADNEDGSNDDEIREVEIELCWRFADMKEPVPALV